MNARDELAELIWDEDACDWRSFGPNDVADAILAAGYRKPATLTTIDQLSGAPRGIVVRELMGLVWEKQGDGEGGEFWVETGDEQEYKASDITLPVTVLYIPGVTK